MKQFLLIKLNHIGDTLIMTPTIRILKERYPEAQIDVIVRSGCDAVLQGNPDIREILTVASPEKSQRTLWGEIKNNYRIVRHIFNRQYDYGFDLSDTDKGKIFLRLSNTRVRGFNRRWVKMKRKHRLVYNAFSDYDWTKRHQVLKDFVTVTDILGLQAEAGPLVVNTDIDVERLKKKLPEMDLDKPYVVIHPTSRWRFKQWLPQGWAEIADWLREEHGMQVIFSSGPSDVETETIDQIVLASRQKHESVRGRLSLREGAWLIENSQLFAGVDTVVMHLAAAVGAPSVALFGPSSEWSWRPWHCRHELVVGVCSCKVSRKFICDKSKPYPCMAGIEVEAVKNQLLLVMAPPTPGQGTP
ncbi:MAG: putative lipopolysaccharide heptosyltransferase III [Magnetococcales bacterium]|nr:putative lipopolysaccharide heptosyltransferase III [Magnetococcales bacterium]